MNYLLIGVLIMVIPGCIRASERVDNLHAMDAEAPRCLYDQETTISDKLENDLILIRDIAHNSLELIDCASMPPRTIVATDRYSCYRAGHGLRFFIDEADNNRLVIINLSHKKAKHMFDGCFSLELRFGDLVVRRKNPDELNLEVKLQRIDWKNS